MRSICWLILSLSACLSTSGCCFRHWKQPSITAMSANPGCGEVPGIPFYLPKPLLVISKNVHHIEEAKVGLTPPAPIPTTFDRQETYAAAELNSTVAFPESAPAPTTFSERTPGQPVDPQTQPIYTSAGAPVSPGTKIPSDGLAPDTFYTYEIVFVPDLTQKYVMQVEGGAGEMRAAMNLVNGWQFTGLGPYYLKDSSTAQNVFAKGVAVRLGLSGAAEVVNSVANLAQTAAAAGGKASSAEVAQIAEAIRAASTEETVDWAFAAPDAWEDEMVGYQDKIVDAQGQPILDADGNEQWATRYAKTNRKFRHRLERYAEVYVYEPHVEGGQMVWRPIAEHVFDREYLGLVNKKANAAAAAADVADPGLDAPAAPAELPALAPSEPIIVESPFLAPPVEVIELPQPVPKDDGR